MLHASFKRTAVYINRIFNVWVLISLLLSDCDVLCYLHRALVDL